MRPFMTLTLKALGIATIALPACMSYTALAQGSVFGEDIVRAARGCAGCIPKRLAVAPAPFTMEDARTAHPNNSNYRYTVKEEGKPDSVLDMWFKDVTENGFTHRTQKCLANGEPDGKAVETKRNWSDLVRDAEFAEALTTITDETLTIGGVAYTCKVYTVKTGNEPTKSKVFWYASERKGMPIKIVHRDGDKDVYTQEMLVYDDGTPKHER
mgnify:CR=1 FL=1